MKTFTLKIILMSLVLLGVSLAPQSHASPPPLPDFVIESLSIYPTNVAEGMPITVTVTVKNQGEAAGDGRYLDVWHNTTNCSPVFGDVGDWWTPVGHLEPGASRTITSPPTIVSNLGTNQLFACIEFEDLVSETNNTNNCCSLSYEAATIASFLAPIYRFWAPNFRGHFYTISEDEKDHVVANLSRDWEYEGVAYHAYKAAVPGTVPVYRFWSARYRGHFYTISENEKSNIIVNLSHDWRYESVAYYVYPNLVFDTKPVYRFWSPRYKHHFFTVSESEKDNVIANLAADWNYEGIAYYVPISPPEPLSTFASFDVESGTERSSSPMEVPPFEVHSISDEGDEVEKDVVGSTVVVEPLAFSNVADSIDLVFPLSYPERDVVVYGYEFLEDKWRCLLSITNSPASVILKNVQSERSFLLEVFVGDPIDGELASVHRSWFESQLDPPDTLNGEDFTVAASDGVGTPMVRLTTPVVDGTMTVKLYSSKVGVVQTLIDVSGGDTVELPLPEWNRWYWVGGWRDVEKALVMSLWLRIEVEN